MDRRRPCNARRRRDERRSNGPGRTQPPLDDLLRAANRGDARAYAGFLRAVAPIVRGIARARGGRTSGPTECEDIVQETLLAIHQKRHTWREDLPVRPWLYAIVRYKVVDAFRARGRRVQLPVEDFAEVLAAPEAARPDRAQRRRAGDRPPRPAVGADRAGDRPRRRQHRRDRRRRSHMTETAVRVALHRAMRKLARLRERMIE